VGTADIRVPSAEENLPSAYVSNVCVAPSARRKGVANALMAKTLTISAEWQIPDVYVHVDADNEAARALYRRNTRHANKGGSTACKERTTRTLEQ